MLVSFVSTLALASFLPDSVFYCSLSLPASISAGVPHSSTSLLYSPSLSFSLLSFLTPSLFSLSQLSPLSHGEKTAALITLLDEACNNASIQVLVLERFTFWDYNSFLFLSP